MGTTANKKGKKVFTNPIHVRTFDSEVDVVNLKLYVFDSNKFCCIINN